ncbi:MAG: Fe2+-dependent dioxygenase [Alphaproteobacteria bacterium]
MLECLSSVLTRDEVKELLGIAETGSFVDGKATAGKRIKHIKENLQLEASEAERKRINEIVAGALNRHEDFKSLVMPKRIAPPMVSRYEPGMSYGDHVDNPLVAGGLPMRTDASVTLFLSPPDAYDGGELVLQTPYGEQEVKLLPGEAVVYDTTVLHRVAPVTRGARLAAVTWVQSLIRDPAQRELLFELNTVVKRLGDERPDAEETRLLYRTYSNLVRMWAEI